MRIQIGFLIFLGLLKASGAEPSRSELHRKAVGEILETTFQDRENRPYLYDPYSLFNWVQRLPNFWWGLNQFKDRQLPNGFFRDKSSQKIVFGCALCHTGKAAGIEIVGLGNKTIDLGRLAKDMRLLPYQSPSLKKLLERVGSEKNINPTAGLVASSVIREWVYDQMGLQQPLDEPKGLTKVPHWWGFSQKKSAGIDWDGYGDAGDNLGWFLGVELASGANPGDIETMKPHAEKLMHNISKLLPPKYPFEIDSKRALRGARVYESQCSRCHGNYSRDNQGLPIFQEPLWVSINIVKTDDSRLKGNTEKFGSLVDLIPAEAELKRSEFGKKNAQGYFAPRLDGIWSRFPYLHNGSVPSLRALLTRPEDRPQVWWVIEAGEASRFDKSSVGLIVPQKDSSAEWLLRRKASQGSWSVYDVNRPEHSNRGHWFQSFDNLTEIQKTDLIEYLKTL